MGKAGRPEDSSRLLNISRERVWCGSASATAPHSLCGAQFCPSPPRDKLVVNNLLPFVIAGVTAGSIYGLNATGLVLGYKTTGIFNFAQGAVAALAAFVFFFLHVDHRIPWPIALVISVGVLGPLIGVALELITRQLPHVSPAYQVLATVGFVVLTIAVCVQWYGADGRFYPAYLPTRGTRIGGVFIGFDQMIIISIGLLACAGLFVFLRTTRLGIALRAVVDGPELLALTGTGPTRIRRYAWGTSTTFAALSGVLLAPSLTLDSVGLSFLVVESFGAAAIGYFANLPLAYFGGLVVGVAGAVATKFVVETTWLVGLPASIPFIILFIALLVTPRARLTKQRLIAVTPPAPSWAAPVPARLVSGAAFAVVLLLIPTFAGIHLAAFTDALAYVILFLSLGLLVRTSGQVSLGHLGFAAVGAAASAHLTHDFNVPWLLAVLAAGLIAVPIGAFVAIPAIRLSGVFLALATLGFAVLLQYLMYPTGLMFGITADGLPARRPHWAGLGSDIRYYYVVLGFVVVTVAAMVLIHHTRPGRLLRALADSPLALETHGATVNLTRLMVFCVSAFFAAISGALLVSSYTVATGNYFSSFLALTTFVVLLIAFAGFPWYAFLAAFNFTVVPSYVTFSGITNYLNMVFGAVALLAPLYATRHRGMPLRVRHHVEVFSDRWARGHERRRQIRGLSRRDGSAEALASPAAVPGDVPGLRPRRNGSRTGLEVRGLRVQYGGNVAVDDVSLSAQPGKITGLIGPNGAGKTTLFNACSGFVKPSRGVIHLDGTAITRASPATRGRMGIGRTFQRVELWPSFTVRENVAMACEASLAGGNLTHHLFSRRGDRRRIATATDAAMSEVGITQIADREARHLSLGQRRLTELARCLAGPFDTLLLDEPSSGLDVVNVQMFVEVLMRVAKKRGLAVLLVEHDVPMVMSVCDGIYVMDAGRLIFEGNPSSVAASDRVKVAYVGTTNTNLGLADV
jgi:ABC-type branched-subunit amino acid transport system ATPase component/branched-subunit amino acid ABC-type transport system permease component